MPTDETNGLGGELSDADRWSRGYVTSMFPKGCAVPMFVPPAMLESARQACPDANIEPTPQLRF